MAGGMTVSLLVLPNETTASKKGGSIEPPSGPQRAFASARAQTSFKFPAADFPRSVTTS